MERENSFFNNVLFPDANLMPLPLSDFTPVYQNQEPELASFNFPLTHEESTQLFDFFSNSKPSPGDTFQHSVSLSLDHSAHRHHPLTQSSSSSSTRKRRLTSDSMVHVVSPPVQRPTKMSDKTQCLQKLMPCDRKMDIATMLEEASKYVQFLQAQIRALSSMPLHSSFVVKNSDSDGRFGCLRMLNRQQLLQVFLNSPVAQTTLYSQGFCVFSLEQLLLMNKLSQENLSP